jgi:ATP-dependent Clp protease ATP-binding subunit ClpC
MRLFQTEGMRQLHFFAREQATRLGTNIIGPEHYLLALVGVTDCVGARVLEALGISLDGVRELILQQVTSCPGTQGEEIQLSPGCKRGLDLARDETRQLANLYLDTHHLLLGLIREGEGLPAQVLAQHGADLSRVRRQAYEMRMRNRQSS